jgi:transposase
MRGMVDAAEPSAILPDDIGALKSIIGVQTLEIERLKEELRLAQHKRFGASSEKFDPNQLGLFDEAEALARAPDAAAAADGSTEITIGEHKRTKGGRKPLSETLPRVRVEHDIPECEKLCPCGSGHARPRIGEMISEQADIVPATVQVLQHVRFKYGPCHACDGVFPEAPQACGAPAQQTEAAPIATVEPRPEVVPEPRAIVVAPLPPQPIPKSIASPKTCAFVVTAKYADGLPLYRLEKILPRYGLEVSRGTLALWMIRLGELIVPLMNLLEETQLGYDVLQMDETTVQVLKEDGRKAQSKSRMWVRRGGPPDTPIIIFNYEPTRSGKIAWRLTEDFKGYLQSDGYSGYDAVGKRADIVHVGCLAHARRYFDEALKAQKVTGRGGLAVEALALIQKIYRVEKIAREAGLSADARKKLRDEKARPVWDELRRWLDRVRNHAPPSTKIGRALGYLDNQWDTLIRVLEDGRLEVDNNRCENAIRPFVIGRNAWLFSDTPAGAQASARLYSLIETAKACGREPYAYLAHVFAELPKATTLAEIEALLPWNVPRTATHSVAA